MESELGRLPGFSGAAYKRAVLGHCTLRPEYNIRHFSGHDNKSGGELSHIHDCRHDRAAGLHHNRDSTGENFRVGRDCHQYGHGQAVGRQLCAGRRANTDIHIDSHDHAYLYAHAKPHSDIQQDADTHLFRHFHAHVYFYADPHIY